MNLVRLITLLALFYFYNILVHFYAQSGCKRLISTLRNVHFLNLLNFCPCLAIRMHLHCHWWNEVVINLRE